MNILGTTASIYLKTSFAIIQHCFLAPVESQGIGKNGAENSQTIQQGIITVESLPEGK
jgi:hypothetical protein